MMFHAEPPRWILKEIAPSPMPYGNGEGSVAGYKVSLDKLLLLRTTMVCARVTLSNVYENYGMPYFL